MFEYVVMNDDDVDGDDECFGPNIIIIMLSVILRGLFSSDPTADTATRHVENWIACLTVSGE